MKLWTYGEAIDRVNSDLDLDNEEFIQADEMAGYFNKGLDFISAKIQDLNEDYLRKSCQGNLTAGSSQVLFSGSDNQGVAFTGASMPPDIYAQKIRGMIYQNGSLMYEVKKLRGERMFMDLAMTNYQSTTQDYRYDLTNPTVQGYRMDLLPAARETGPLLTLWYLRNLGRIPLPSAGSLALSRATILDVPEFAQFLIAYVKCLVLPKEGDPRFPLAKGDADILEAQMVTTLKDRVVDNDNRMEMDLSYYQEHV